MFHRKCLRIIRMFALRRSGKLLMLLREWFRGRLRHNLRHKIPASCHKTLKTLAGPTRLELATSCVTGSIRITILLARLALFCVIVHGLGRYLGVKGPKLDPNFRRNQGGLVPYPSLIFPFDGEFLLVDTAPELQSLGCGTLSRSPLFFTS
jgi:hypothetical protein